MARWKRTSEPSQLESDSTLPLSWRTFWLIHCIKKTYGKKFTILFSTSPGPTADVLFSNNIQKKNNQHKLHSAYKNSTLSRKRVSQCQWGRGVLEMVHEEGKSFIPLSNYILIHAKGFLLMFSSVITIADSYESWLRS